MYQLEDIIEHFDLDKVRTAVIGDPSAALFTFDIAPCQQMVWRCIEKWLARDAWVFKIEATEEHFTHFDGVAHGITDLRGTIVRPFKTIEQAYVGKTFVLDWKTSRATLDKTWEDRLFDSWQWKLYASHYGAGLVFYRGVNDRDDTRELILEPPPDVSAETETQFKQILEYRNKLISNEEVPWPRNMPSACGAYGRECEYQDDCRTEGYVRDYVPLTELNAPLSYSSMSRMMLCPEKHRRYILDRGGDKGDTEETARGRAVHRGLEEVYKQLAVLQNKGVL